MTLERFLTLLAFAVFCGFLAILMLWVPRLDLGAVVVVAVLLCGYDLFRHRPPNGR
ncbi:hypothetical protein [Mangrovibrevibacter kandeliae]|uniref:hypothetical protein n=1 Tax=Mangrovibrevibacter kandeliae TaxID=2968473 RepID=UPI002117E543|nr:MULTISPECIES: hypothetical protein [unclassified Aurantimonas]MCQ8783132.1 hypothetical protein [Aurantimonas sp. CSK15Z-1]MCW4115679.1 hypothetical protein [Aurantimonas sp. MSK8Z-1]